MTCNGDSCFVDEIIEQELQKKKSGAKKVQNDKAHKNVAKLFDTLEPIDYDAPGTTVRESGV